MRHINTCSLFCLMRSKIICRGCKKLTELAAKGCCRNCYRKIGTPIVVCKVCKRETNHHGRGLCHRCYIRTVIPDYYRLRSRQQYSGITPKVFEQLPKACQICGFDKIVDAHHLIPKSKGGSHDVSNLIVLCPNHHKMVHHADHRAEAIKMIEKVLGKPYPYEF